MRRLFALCLVLVVVLSGCTVSAEPVRRTDFCLDTVVTVTLYDPTDEALLTAVFDYARQLEGLLSRTIPGSDVDRINQADGRSVTVSQDTLTVLQAALDYAEWSEGLFDVSIAPLSDLWDFTSGANRLPDTADLTAAAELVDYRKIIIEGTSVTLPAGMKLDLGGLAKGYIADQMAAFLRERGVTSGLLDLGGDIVAIGVKPDGTPFRVGIQKPFGQQGETVDSMSLDHAIATSGVYQRSFTVDGVLYHHILDPKTGLPVQNGLVSASVMADTAMEADALATIAVLAGPEQAETLVTAKGGQLCSLLRNH